MRRLCALTGLAALCCAGCGEGGEPSPQVDPAPASDAGEIGSQGDALAIDAALPADAAAADGGKDTDATAGADAVAVTDAALDAGAIAPIDAGLGGSDAAKPDSGDGPNIWQRCFADIYDPDISNMDYDQFGPSYGEHCYGTSHQQIADVERVVFLGDSVTVGSPPTQSQDFYRARLADALAARFGLEAPSALWKSANPLTGESGLRSSGDFASCAKWGARADDLMRDHSQVEDCLPEEERHKRTLVIMTIGGNDLAALTRDGAHAPYEESRAMFEELVALLGDTLRWIKEPGRFPNGVFVLFSNVFEYTDGTGDLSSCPAAAAAGFSEPWDHPEWLEELVIWVNEQYMALAVETQSDLLMMLEHFCGHGFRNEDPESRCYRGPDTERWLDLTCIHPNPTGHARIAEMFMAMVGE